MNLAQQTNPRPDRNESCCAVVRNVLALLATHHPTIRPDDVPHLAGDLLDWSKLVEVAFVKEWKDTIDAISTDESPGQQASGRQREELFAGPQNLKQLFEAAKISADAFEHLQCAGIVLGNLISNEIWRTHYNLAVAIQKQVDSFWNASARQALIDGNFSMGGVFLSFPDYPTKAPELEGLE